MLESSSLLRQRRHRRKSDVSSGSSDTPGTSSMSPLRLRDDHSDDDGARTVPIPMQGQTLGISSSPSQLPSLASSLHEHKPKQGHELDATLQDRFGSEIPDHPFVRTRPRRSGTYSTYTNRRRGSMQQSVASKSPDPISSDHGLDNNDQALDIPLAVVIIPPLGTILIGGDFFKDFFLLLLMFFYLHQLIKVPWQLYLASRPRLTRQGVRLTDSTLHDNFPPELRDLYTLAESELKAAELFYLALSVLSPLIGAALLRYVSTALAGRDYISWFSTGLFVLVTGIRPWGHLTRRLRERTETLQETIEQTRGYIDLMKTGEDNILSRIVELEDSVATSKETVEESKNEMDMSLNIIDATLDKLASDVEHQFRAMNERIGLLESALREVSGDRKGVESRKARRMFVGSVDKWFSTPSNLTSKSEHESPDLLHSVTGRRRRLSKARERPRSKSLLSSLSPLPEDQSTSTVTRPSAYAASHSQFKIFSWFQSWIEFAVQTLLNWVAYFPRIGRELVWSFVLSLKRSIV